MEKGSKHQRFWGEFLLCFWYLFTFKPPSLVSEQPLDTELVHIHPHKHRGTFTSSSMAIHTKSRGFSNSKAVFHRAMPCRGTWIKDKVPCARSGGDLTPLREGLFSVPPNSWTSVKGIRCQPQAHAQSCLISAFLTVHIN